MKEQAVNILHAAEKCMREKGFHNTTVHNIAKEAGISTGLIYRYFKNKDGIIEALFTDTIQKVKVIVDIDYNGIEVSCSAFFRDEQAKELEKKVILLMNISAEATRNEKLRKIVRASLDQLKEDFILREKQINSNCDTQIIETRLYFLSVIIDGLVFRRSSKGFLNENKLGRTIKYIFEQIAIT
nr:TetR/AcrR family transcriptional regulator [Pantoea dispersa]